MCLKTPLLLAFFCIMHPVRSTQNYHSAVEETGFITPGKEFLLAKPQSLANSRILFVRVGENDITTDIDCDRFEKCAPSHQDIQVNKFISDDYDKIKITQDYALIELKVPVEFNDYVQPVCLRPAAMDHATYIGKRVFVAGFGLVSSDPPKDPTQLQYIKIPILDDSICNLIYNKHNFKHYRKSVVYRTSQQKRDFLSRRFWWSCNHVYERGW
ncbi:hypothetical protein NQ315_009695 [Exocentrus adspersus]|uniref:Peptidase S1 domain-containing protein n=1 Tax=Exocentrus adspersus TaxID=1586481 RepID=A0AAV8WHD5_9CUCU|nr:hypothetical protein NQ315_009695 [Exocentrus adspersus]